MKVERNNDGWLTNFEVYASLKAREIRSKSFSRPGAAVEIETQVLEYLQDTSVTRMTPESINNFVQAIKPYGLVEAEILEVLNHAPREDHMVHLILELGEERELTSHVDDLLEKVSDVLLVSENEAKELWTAVSEEEKAKSEASGNKRGNDKHHGGSRGRGGGNGGHRGKWKK